MMSRRAPPPAAVLFAVLVLAALLCHGLLLWAPPIFDDEAFVFANTKVTGPWPGLGAFFGGTFGNGEYEPLMTLLHWGLHHLFGAAVFPYRATSLLFHWAVVFLFWRLARRFLDEAMALAVAALFAVFPAHIEVIALTSFKKHIAVACFGLGLMNVQQEERLSRLQRAVPGAVLLGLGLLCKESAVIFAPLAAAAAAARGGFRGLREERVFLGSLLGVCAAYALLRLAILPRTLMPLMGGGWLTHGLTCGKILLWHLGQLVLPASLALEHSLGVVRGTAEAALVVLGVLSWGALGIFLWRKDRIAAFGWMWVSLALLPFLNIIPFLNFSLVANRYDYMAGAGFLLLVGRLSQGALRARLPGGGRRVLLAAVLPFGFYALLGMRYAVLFSSPFDLWSDSARSAPEHPRVHAALGGLYASWHDLVAAERELRRSIALSPALPEPYVPLAWLLAETGRGPEALRLARWRLTLRPDALAWGSLGQILAREGRFAEALPFLEKFKEMRPGPYAELALAQCLLALGEPDRAEKALRAVRDDPQLEAKALRGLGDVELVRGH
ncbi:MAG: tetratricopeptide repeat protein, partial [Elusimicrobiota bacterium]